MILALLLAISPIHDLAVEAAAPTPTVLHWTAPSFDARNGRGDPLTTSPLTDLCCCTVWYVPQMAVPDPSIAGPSGWKAQTAPWMLAELSCSPGSAMSYTMPSWASWGTAFVTCRDTRSNASQWSNLAPSRTH